MTTFVATGELSAAARARVARPLYAGELTDGDARAQGCQLITTAHGAESAADHINLWLMVDPQGMVQGVRYRTAATGELLAAYDAMAELSLGRKLTDLATITPREVEAHLRQDAAGPVLHLGEDADVPFYVLTKAAERGTQKPAAGTAVVGGEAAALPWADIGLFEKVRRIESVLDQHVRPALASDGGGIDLVDLKSDDLHVQYHGACGSCSSSIGGTLQFIQDSLNNHLGTTLQVKVTGMEMPELI